MEHKGGTTDTTITSSAPQQVSHKANQLSPSQGAQKRVDGTKTDTSAVYTLG